MADGRGGLRLWRLAATTSTDTVRHIEFYITQVWGDILMQRSLVRIPADDMTPKKA